MIIQDDGRIPLNRPYVAFVLVMSLICLGSIIVKMDLDLYRDWGKGRPSDRIWGILFVIAFNLAILASLAALVRKIYRDANTRLGKKCISQPSLLGRKQIAWKTVTEVKTNGFGYQIVSPTTKIMVTPYAYKDPTFVIETIGKRIAEARTPIS